MCLMRDKGDTTVKTPARSEDGVTVDPIDPNPYRRQSSGNTSGGRKGASNPNSGASRAKARANKSKGKG